MRFLSLLVFLFFSIIAFSQKKASMRIREAELANDTLILKYSIKNISPNSFSYYVPGIRDFKYYLIGVSLFDIHKRKNYKYKVQSGGELDKLTVDKDECVNIAPGDSIDFKLSLDIRSFYLNRKLSTNLNLTLAIFYEFDSVWCTDCSYKLLTENLFAETKVQIHSPGNRRIFQ